MSGIYFNNTLQSMSPSCQSCYVIPLKFIIFQVKSRNVGQPVYLKVPIMLIFQFIFLLWVSTGKCLHSLM